MTTYEPFIAAFTGQLATFVGKDGRRWIFKKPLPRIEHRKSYMLKMDSSTGVISFLTITPPRTQEGFAR